MGFGLDSLFGKADASPTMDKLDLAGALKEGADYNISTIEDFKDYGPELAQFMQGLYKDTVDPRALQAQDTAYNIGNQLATTGQTDLMGDFFNYARRTGLETAARTGAPIYSGFAQGVGANLGSQQILANQMGGLGILNQQAGVDRGLAQQFQQPGLGLFQNNLVSPGQSIQVGQYNNEIQNQNKLINFANSQRESWFDSLLTQTAKSVVGMPFNFVGNAANVVASSPQLAASFFMSAYGGDGSQVGNYAPTQQSQMSAQGNANQMAQNSGSGGQSAGGGIGGMLGGGGGGGGSPFQFAF